MQHRLTTLLAVLAQGVVISVPAAHASEADKAVELQEVNVWGTQVSSSSVYLGEGDIEVKQADHLSDLLRDQPGMDIGGTHSTNQRINIRGLGDTDLNVTIDGANQNTFMYHHMGNLLINADILKSVDARVGANSIVNGGLGGSVAFETKDPGDLLAPDDKFGGRVSASAASNKAQSGSVTLYGRMGEQADALLYTTYVNRDNPEDGDGKETLGNDGEIKNTLLKLGADITDKQRLELSHDIYHDEGEYSPRPDMGVATNASITGDTVYPTEYKRTTTVLKHEADLSERSRVSSSLSRNNLDLERNSTPDAEPTLQGGKAVNTHFNITAESDLELGNTSHQLTYGVEVLQQKATSRRNGVDLTTEKGTNRAVFVEDRIEFANGIAVTPGVRVDSYKANTASSKDTFTETSAALAAEVSLNNDFTFVASSTQLFKGPELAEVFIDGAGSLRNNPDIKPETGINNELGVRFDKPGFLGADRFTASVKGFKTKIDDAITEVDYPFDDETGRGAPTWFVNNSALEIEGVELSARYKKNNLGTTLSYASAESEFTATGEPLDREIGDTITLGVDYQIPAKKLGLNWTTIHVMEEDNVATGSEPKPSYTVTNVAASWQPPNTKNLNLSFGVDNLLDEAYTAHASRVGDSNHPVFGELHLNDYEPGRNIKFTASYDF